MPNTNAIRAAVLRRPSHWLWKTARGLVTVALLAWVVQKLDWQQVWRSVLTAKLHWLVLALSYPVLTMAIDALRWQVLLRAMGHLVTWSELFRINLVGIFFDNFLPSTIGSDTYRALCLSRQYVPSEVLATILLGRVVSLFSLLGLGLACLLTLQAYLPADVYWMCLSVLGSGLGLIGGGLILLRTAQYGDTSRWSHRLLCRSESLTLFVQSMHQCLALRPFIVSITLSLLLYTVAVAAVVVIAHAYGVPAAQWWFVACVAPLGFIATMLPISIAGHGIRETAFIYLLSHIGIIPEVGLTIAISSYGAVALVSLLGGLMYLLNTMASKRPMQALDTPPVVRTPTDLYSH